MLRGGEMDSDDSSPRPSQEEVAVVPRPVTDVERLRRIRVLGRVCGGLTNSDGELRQGLTVLLHPDAVASRLDATRLNELLSLENAHAIFR